MFQLKDVQDKAKVFLAALQSLDNSILINQQTEQKVKYRARELHGARKLAKRRCLTSKLLAGVSCFFKIRHLYCLWATGGIPQETGRTQCTLSPSFYMSKKIGNGFAKHEQTVPFGCIQVGGQVLGPA